MDICSEPSKNNTNSYEHAYFRFGDLPSELQIQVLQNVKRLHELLTFRLVSKQSNSLVMDPVFWHELSFNGKQQPKKDGTGVSRPYYHGSDANVIIHQASHYANQPFPPSSQLIPSLSGSSLNSPLDSNKLRMEDSFISFTTLLSSLEPTARHINSVTIEKWQGMSNTQSLWQNLTKYPNMNSILINHSTIKSDWSSSIFKEKSVWNHLSRLELKNCLNIVDISGIIFMMPNLQDLNLEGCINISSFTPLAPRGMQNLPYKSVNLSFTKIVDFELISLITGSPQLQELRLERCYSLTETSLVVIGYNREANQTEENEEADLSKINAINGMGMFATLTSSVSQKLKVLSLKDCCDLADKSVRYLAGCRQLEYLNIRGLRNVNEETTDWLHSQGVPLRTALSPLGRWRYWK